MSQKTVFGIIGGALGAAALAALFVPYERKQSEDGFQLTAVAYEVSCRNDGENRNYHVNLFPFVRKQIALFKDLFTEVREKVQTKKSEADECVDFDAPESMEDLKDLTEEVLGE
ncbi:MAG: hypothetical protein IKS34_05170 [Clostridia bacterium]|nr:hypothetical protein [Clostridia bacterium]